MARRPFDPKKARGGDSGSDDAFGDLFSGLGDPPPVDANGGGGSQPPEPARSAGTSDDRPLSVTALSNLIGEALSKGVPARVRVVGEVSNARPGRHLYFSLKDEEAVISCAMWHSDLRKLEEIPRDGDSVEVWGQVGHYAKQGRTQLYAKSIEPVGLGALEARFRALVAELREEGYFDAQRKRPTPRHPGRIAIVTGAGSAALADCLRTARDRMPTTDLLVVPVLVQGDGAAEQVARAIRGLDAAAGRLGIDAILVTRGGGSLEDLWAFNERVVADAAHDCRIPLVAAIGHESDNTIVELVADHRASTPTQAITHLLPDRRELARALARDRGRLSRAAANVISEARMRLDLARRHEFLRRPADRLAERRRGIESLRRRLRGAIERRLRDERVELPRIRSRLTAAILRRRPRPETVRSLERRLHAAASRRLDRSRGQVEQATRRLRSVGPAEVLSRGFAIVTDDSGSVVRSAGRTLAGAALRVQLADGGLEVRVERSDPDRSIDDPSGA
ncbi:MAG: exodeoxyribonuclease VII large subunit [Phycisphaerales bacterium]